MTSRIRHDLRNVAIIAHVDHGKTTLVDALLKQSHTFRDNQEVGRLIMDRGDLEREKGITILAKNTAIRYGEVWINIIDTPGHADFGGEVERVLNMADGCLLLIDAAEGPMPQTRFVLRKAFEVGRAGLEPETMTDTLEPLLEAIIHHVPAPIEEEGGFQALVANLGWDDYTGRLAVGRITRGQIRPGDSVAVLREKDTVRGKVAKVMLHRGLGTEPVELARAGDIVVLTGIDDVAIGDTLADPEYPDPLPRINIEEPTVRMTFSVNNSPFAGRESQYSTSRQLRARLLRELDLNLGLRFEETDSADEFVVSGRGELHLAVLIETMRREGYEFAVSRPEVIVKEVEGRRMEPVEHLTVDVPEEFVGGISEALGRRRGENIEISYEPNSRVRLEYAIPTRGLIGFRNVFLTLTAGNGVMGSLLLGYRPWAGDLNAQRNGVLTASQPGVAVAYGLANAQERGTTFIEAGEPVYEGMIVGLNKRGEDIAVNVCKEKQKTNVRSSTSDIAVRLTPALKMSLEQCLDFLGDDELLEVTPRAIRLRKRWLSQADRARRRSRAAQGAPA